jgi:hypothetical protein
MGSLGDCEPDDPSGEPTSPEDKAWLARQARYERQTERLAFFLSILIPAAIVILPIVWWTQWR